ncbi:Zinc finger, C2H2 type [Popillia japonica]|uniref:Zinc finger, C2H2 type n=1 Tax=Popillia japonica TaxID=7064 RepID=A0AAW1JC11_POPJA
MKSLYYRDSESGKENARLDEMLMACASVQVVDNNLTVYECRTCAKIFYTLEGLRCHKKIHSGKMFKCKQCDRSYIRLNHLHRHELSHGRRKMHVCKICNKTLTRLEHLKRHLVTHLKEKPYGCPNCNRGFNRAEHLQNHIKSCKGEKVYVCDICNKAFTREDSMEIHRRLHGNRQPALPTLDNLNNIEEHYMEIEFDDKANVFSDLSDGEDVDVADQTMEPEVEVSENNDEQKINEIAEITKEIYAEIDPPEILAEKAKIEEEMFRENENGNAADDELLDADNGNDYESDR